MKILDKLLNKKTNFKAGYCLIREIPASATLVQTPQNFMAPQSLDFRDMCIQTSNQGQLPHCAGYSTAGYIEVQNWRTKHYPEQVTGSEIYLEAKKHDGYNGDGTYLPNAAQAAITLGLISGKPEYVQKDQNQLRFAIHEKAVCIGSFVITDEWNSVASDGVIPNWQNKTSSLGGHAVLICGYNKSGVYIQNSWGPMWGLYGFCFLSWEQFDRQFQHGMLIR